jgi:hypothetical protein
MPSSKAKLPPARYSKKRSAYSPPLERAMPSRRSQVTVSTARSPPGAKGARECGAIERAVAAWIIGGPYVCHDGGRKRPPNPPEFGRVLPPAARTNKHVLARLCFDGGRKRPPNPPEFGRVLPPAARTTSTSSLGSVSMGAASGPQTPRNSGGCYPRRLALRARSTTPPEFRLCSNGRGRAQGVRESDGGARKTLEKCDGTSKPG